MTLSGALEGPGIQLEAMFPLSWARVRTHTGREMSAHKKISSAHNFPLNNVFALISYILF